jgi:hypothetical protein
MAGLQVWVWLLCAMCMSCNSDKDELSKLWAVAVDHHQSSRVEAAIVVSPALLHYLTSPSLIGLTQGYQAVIDAYPGLVKPAYSNAAALLLQQASIICLHAISPFTLFFPLFPGKLRGRLHFVVTSLAVL